MTSSGAVLRGRSLIIETAKRKTCVTHSVLALYYQVQLGVPDLHRVGVRGQVQIRRCIILSVEQVLGDLTLHNQPEGSRQNLSLITRPSCTEAREDQILSFYHLLLYVRGSLEPASKKHCGWWIFLQCSCSHLRQPINETV